MRSGPQQSQAGKLAEQYCKDHIEKPSRTIARMLFNDYPAVFKDVEHARGLVRTNRHESGDKKRANKVITTKFAGILPDRSADEKPYVLSGKRSAGIIADLHIPNHRSKPIDIALDTLDSHKIDTLIILGDLLDNTPFTHHHHRPASNKDVVEWFNMAERFLEYLRQRYPSCEIIWAEGNHDNWYEQYLIRHAPILFGDHHYLLETRLNLEEYGIKFIGQEKLIRLGKLALCHGHYLLRGVFSPVNTARGIYNKAKVSCMVGHSHVTSEHTSTDLYREITTTWSIGCLCTLTPSYQPMGGNVNHGFAHVQVSDDGDYSVTNYRIHNDKLL